jgi:hypothetical protein
LSVARRTWIDDDGDVIEVVPLEEVEFPVDMPGRRRNWARAVRRYEIRQARFRAKDSR